MISDVLCFVDELLMKVINKAKHERITFGNDPISAIEYPSSISSKHGPSLLQSRSPKFGIYGKRSIRRQESTRQFTAFCTSSLIFISISGVNFVSAKAVGHMTPSSRFAWSLNPSVAYRALNFCALWKKQITFPSFA